MIESVLVPKERIKIFNESIIAELERLGVKIRRSENVIEIEGEGLERIQVKDIVKAIARGFFPKKAFLLLNDNVALEIIEIPGNEKTLKRIKARIIGSEGKTRLRIEELTGCALSVYGKTISIIGDFEKISSAKKAVKMFISGAPHKTVYRFLESVTLKRTAEKIR